MNIKEAWKALWGSQKAFTPTGSYSFVNGKITWISDNVENYINDGYSANDIIYSIVSITTEKIRVAPWNAYKIKDEGALKQYRSEMRKKDFNYNKALDLRTKALELYTADAKLNELLQYPNEDESFSDLVAHSSAFKQITGNRFVRGEVLKAGLNGGKPNKLYNLPPQYMAIFNNGAFPVRATGYQLNIGQTIPFDRVEVLHDKYLNMSFDVNGGHLYGMSPLKAALFNMTRSKYAKEASTKAFENQGPGGVLYVDDDRLSGEQTTEQALAVKRKWIQEYSGREATKKVVVSGYKVGWEEMGLSPVDLGVLEAEKWDLNMLCGVFNFPIQMLNAEISTLDNVKEAEKVLTRRTAMPLMTSFRENFNRKLHEDWGYKGKNIIADFDLTVYDELAADKASLTKVAYDSWWLPIERKYELQQEEIPEWMDEDTKRMIVIPSGFQKLSDLNSLDNELDNVIEEEDQNTKP